MTKKLVATMVACLLFVSAARADATDDRLKRLHELYQCPIFAYLIAIHHAPLSAKDRYLTAAIADPVDEKYYAQCIFHNRDRVMHCEASSPFYHEQLKRFFTSDRLTLLKSLGYTTKPSKNNFHLERKVPNIDALSDIAGLYVETLGRVFDMQLDETLSYHAPLVKATPEGVGEGTKHCAPMISLR